MEDCRPRVGEVVKIGDDEDTMILKVYAVDLEESVWTCLVANEEHGVLLLNFDENRNFTVLGPTFSFEEEV